VLLQFEKGEPNTQFQNELPKFLRILCDFAAGEQDNESDAHTVSVQPIPTHTP
jgi:hypothetical protein